MRITDADALRGGCTMLQVQDSAARWRSFFEETCANEISALAASWPKQISFMIDFPAIQAWDCLLYTSPSPRD